jgi:hypothetical protein
VGSKTAQPRKQLWLKLLLAVSLCLLGVGGASYYFSRQASIENSGGGAVVPVQVEEKAAERIEKVGKKEPPVATTVPQGEKDEQGTNMRIGPLEMSD